MQGLKWSLNDPEQRLEKLALERNIQIIQPLSEFRVESSGAPLFFGGIGHMTPRGHAVMAKAIADYLTNHSLLPAARASK
jgi:hypothetical protein